MNGFAGVQEAVSTSTAGFNQKVQQIVQSSNASLTQGILYSACRICLHSLRQFSLAFDHEHRAKRARIETTDGLVTDAQSGYRYMQRQVDSTSRAIEGATTRVLTDTADLSTAVDKLNVGSSTSLGNIRRTTQGLVEEATREDKVLGTTPRKRPRKVMEDLPPTEHRDILVRRFRSQGVSSVGSETFLAEHLPLPEEELGSPVVDGMVVDSPIDASASDEENRSESTSDGSPPALVQSPASSSSSSTSTRTIPVPIVPSIPTLKQPSKTTLAQLGTLTASKAANVVVRARPQRTRRTVGQR